jgi:hypothetical protein
MTTVYVYTTRGLSGDEHPSQLVHGVYDNREAAEIHRRNYGGNGSGRISEFELESTWSDSDRFESELDQREGETADEWSRRTTENENQ